LAVVLVETMELLSQVQMAVLAVAVEVELMLEVLLQVDKVFREAVVEVRQILVVVEAVGLAL
jgi:hypothetical protein